MIFLSTGIVSALLVLRLFSGLSQSVGLNILLFLSSGILLLQAANLLVKNIMQVAQYLRWREFVVAFFVMAIGGSLPNLFVGIFSAIHDIPELSFGDIVGNGLADLTLVAALAVFLGKELKGESRVVQTSVFFMSVAAILPLLLLLDGTLGREDAIILILMFLFYSVWLLSKRRIFTHLYTLEGKETPLKEFKGFTQGLFFLLVGTLAMGISAQAVIETTIFFAQTFHIPLILIGILMVGLGSALPETYFTIVSAAKNQQWIILGVLIGSVTVLSTLILGIVALLNPIEIEDFSPFAIARFFLIISALLFLVFLRTGKKITKKEAFILLGLYITFVVAELLFK